MPIAVKCAIITNFIIKTIEVTNESPTCKGSMVQFSILVQDVFIHDNIRHKLGISASVLTCTVCQFAVHKCCKPIKLTSIADFVNIAVLGGWLKLKLICATHNAIPVDVAVVRRSVLIAIYHFPSTIYIIINLGSADNGIIVSAYGLSPFTKRLTLLQKISHFAALELCCGLAFCLTGYVGAVYADLI